MRCAGENVESLSTIFGLIIITFATRRHRCLTEAKLYTRAYTCVWTFVPAAMFTLDFKYKRMKCNWSFFAPLNYGARL